MKLSAYLRLMRFHKPVGIFLLWFPIAWALWLANQGTPPLVLLIYFMLGTILMRAAGCVVNDIADRNIDRHVKRTQLRPLTNNEVSLSEALVIFILSLLAAFVIVMQLPRTCFYYALLALAITIIYPFCKRFIYVPQLVLGIAFSIGIPMVYNASMKMPNTEMAILLLINFLWIVSYDTMYAMVDREDDLRIGVKSTAVLFAQYDCLIILLLQACLHVLWLGLAFVHHFSLLFYGVWGIAALILMHQQKLVSSRDIEACFKAFSTNIWYGATMWVAIIVA
ncbi:4-hydroxybenzoate octaprenyltransferase [Legionella nagasakiensis]|uniref:4-hydroxybenzoate octaprenyltransferase n=1 Tax=Legionella nagasakiensis TaxID=535290 RepID=UPI0010542DA0|nr:4-hydroxybenzoate octaprenyltransferase [Legionella nagasakiensis]